ncbi:hypothetical protein [Mucilaginibacter gotjawali]|uniref:Uncharacterized protein n=2 Tax=Mucilaginibacter gotjawali TaxID=1550579 RepID=A0A120MYM6_9SPHI|nr:hypothetical protein [Mucilaginibacter gotjawali]MBB3055481.1 hypothetical protein [Mucilaginibacter gotjawali]BAU53240.1 hypothetical protein MgSA37_01407 [Mucilaginibacter gotjawali]
MKTIFIAFLTVSVFLSLTSSSQPKKGDVIQFDISPVLNASPITTFLDNSLVGWTIGIDGGGQADGYCTKSAALFNKQDTAHALPDDALFPANHFHPAIQLHYSSEYSTDNQACSMAGISTAQFSVPKAKYKAIFLALTSAEGSSALKITLIYTDGSIVKNVLLPDYYQDIPLNDKNFCYLAHNLAKWGPDNQMTEKDHHNIDLLKLIPDPKRKLKGIKISKGKKGYLVFWAAAGLK